MDIAVVRKPYIAISGTGSGNIAVGSSIDIRHGKGFFVPVRGGVQQYTQSNNPEMYYPKSARNPHDISERLR